MKAQQFPEDIQCIVEPNLGCGGIFISNIEAAQNPQTLKKFGIGAVITAIKGKNLDKEIPTHIEYLYIPAVDHESFDLSYYFEDSNKFIHEERTRTNVLVHCMAGISRSVTLVIAYLMKFTGKTFDEAYNFVKSRRKIIHPNSSFVSQLQTYEHSLPKTLCQSRKHSVSPVPVKKMNSSHDPKLTLQGHTNRSYDDLLRQSIRTIFVHKNKQNIRIL